MWARLWGQRRSLRKFRWERFLLKLSEAVGSEPERTKRPRKIHSWQVQKCCRVAHCTRALKKKQRRWEDTAVIWHLQSEMSFNTEWVLENCKLHSLLWMCSRALFPIHFQSLSARLRKDWLWFFLSWVGFVLSHTVHTALMESVADVI